MNDEKPNYTPPSMGLHPEDPYYDELLAELRGANRPKEGGTLSLPVICLILFVGITVVSVAITLLHR